MKPQSNPLLRSLILAASVAACSAASAATFQWNGSSSSLWSLPANWSAAGVPVSGEHRININCGTITAKTNDAVFDLETPLVVGGNTIRGLVVGSGTTNGYSKLRITSGTLSTAGNTLPGNNSAPDLRDVLGNNAGTQAHFELAGGNYISGTAGLTIGLGGGPTSVFSIDSANSTATITRLYLNSTLATVNLNAGTLATNSIFPGGTAALIQFNGGTLKPRLAAPAFLADTAVLTVRVKEGGAFIDTSGDTGLGVDVTIGEPLLQDPDSPGGGLTKNGAGLLNLTGSSTTTGPVNVNQGGLAIRAAATSWTPSSFRHAGNLLRIDLGVYNPSNATVIETDVLTVETPVTLQVAGSRFVVGQIPLISYGSKNITGSLTLDPASLPANVVATLVDNGTDLIYLDVTSAPEVFDWSGAFEPPGSGTWDTTSQNWNNHTTAYSTAGTQIANFPDITGGGTVDVTAAFSPLAVNISNASGNPYTFEGSGKITGSTAVNKSNTGWTLFPNGNHDYSGTTTISAGALIRQSADSTTGDIAVTADNASFVLDGGVTDGAGQTLYLAGRGITGANYFYNGSAVQRGALQSLEGANTWEGNIVLTSNSNTIFNRIGVQNGASLTLTGSISENVAGAFLLLRAGNAGDNITLSGPSTYSYTSETQIFSTGGSIILGDHNKLPTNQLINLTSGGTTVFDLNGYNQECSGIWGGAVGLGATITNNGGNPSVLTSSPITGISLSFNALIADGSNTVSIVKNGEGSQVLSFANTYTGTTTVNAGILSINGDQTNATGDVLVNGGSLGGAGIIGGAVTVGPLGRLNPAFVVTAGATGILTVQSADLTDGGTLVIDLNDANTQKSDLLMVNDTLDVTGAKLILNVTGTPGQESYLIASAFAITGTISPGDVTGLPSGYQLVQQATEIRLEKSAGSPYETWGATYGLAAGSEGGDLDNDGLSNFHEFAFGLLPNDASSLNPIIAPIDKTTGKFRYQRLAASGLTYRIWTSSDLNTWTEDSTAVQSPTPAGANESVEVTLSATAPLAADKLFLRVQASE